MPYHRNNSFFGSLLSNTVANGTDFKNEKDYRLFMAVAENNLFGIEIAMSLGGNPLAVHRRYGLTAIHTAMDDQESDEKSYVKLRLLLENTQFSNAQAVYFGQEVHTPVCIAIQQGKLHCLEFLTQHKAQFTSCHRNCVEPLLQAIALHFNINTYSEAHIKLESLLSDPQNTLAPPNASTNIFTPSIKHLTKAAGIFPYMSFSSPAKHTDKIVSLLLEKIGNNFKVPKRKNDTIALPSLQRHTNDLFLSPFFATSTDFDNKLDYKLFMAVVKDDWEEMKKTMKEGGNPFAIHKRHGFTAIHAAIRDQDSDSLSHEKLALLLKKNVQSPTDQPIHFPSDQTMHSGYEMHTPMCVAIQQGKLKCVEIFIQHQAQFHLCNKYDEVLKEVQGKFLPLRSNKCKGPLMHAVDFNSSIACYVDTYPIVKALLSAPQASQISESAYHDAFMALTEYAWPYIHAENQKISHAHRIENIHKFADLLLKKLDGNPDIANNEDGKTALHYVIDRYGRLMEYLIRAGANINYQDKDGNTPLYSACRAIDLNQRIPIPKEIGRFGYILILIAAGADLSLKNKWGEIPFDRLSKQCKDEIKKELHQYLEKVAQKWGLSQPIDLAGNTLNKDTQKVAAYFLSRLGQTNQTTLLFVLGLKHPDQIFQPSDNKYQKTQNWLAILKEKIQTYISQNLLPSASGTLIDSSSKEFIVTLPDNLKLQILEDCFENKLTEQDYSLLDIPPECAPTSKTLLSILIKALPNALEPADTLQHKTSQEITKGLRP